MAIFCATWRRCSVYETIDTEFMTDIFISYSRKDLERVKPIVKELLQKGWSVFWDLEIPLGETWRGYIKKKLDESTCVLVVWSQFSISSDWVIAEAEEAKKRGIMVPILLDVVEPPFGFSHIHSADISSWNNNSSHLIFQQCVDAITFRLSRTVGVISKSDVVHSSFSPIVVPQVPPNFVLIRGGEFTMGSPSYEPEHGSHEMQHQVIVSDFYMGKFAVTQAEWRSVTGTNPSSFQGENLPVEQVSWDDCQVFIQALKWADR